MKIVKLIKYRATPTFFQALVDLDDLHKNKDIENKFHEIATILNERYGDKLREINLDILISEK